MSGDRREAIDGLRAALDVLEGASTRLELAQTLVELGAAVEALTSSERRVATLASEGRTNREIARSSR